MRFVVGSIPALETPSVENHNPPTTFIPTIAESARTDFYPSRVSSPRGRKRFIPVQGLFGRDASTISLLAAGTFGGSRPRSRKTRDEGLLNEESVLNRLTSCCFPQQSPSLSNRPAVF